MIELPNTLMENSLNILALHFIIRFPILSFLIEEIKTCTVDVSRKSIFASIYL